MDRDSLLNAELRDAIETLRPGHDDLAAREMQPLAQAIVEDARVADLQAHIGRTDALVLDALHDVPVPAGLSERLLAGLAAASLSPASLTASEAKPAKRFGRRAFAAGLGLATAVAILAGYFLWPRPTPEFGPEAILFAALELASPDDSQSLSLRDEQPSDEFLPPTTIALDESARWQPGRERFLGRKSVVYDLAPPGQPRAILYVTASDGSRSAPRLTMVPQAPLERVLTTAGEAATTWTDGERLFVLVVAGDGRELRRWVREPGAMASLVPMGGTRCITLMLAPRSLSGV